MASSTARRPYTSPLSSVDWPLDESPERPAVRLVEVVGNHMLPPDLGLAKSNLLGTRFGPKSHGHRRPCVRTPSPSGAPLRIAPAYHPSA